MGFFIFLALLVGASAGFLFLRALTSRRGPTTALVRIGIAAGEEEAGLWQQALAQSGIWSRMSPGAVAGYPGIGYHFELWVKENDAALARDVLGLDEPS